MNRCVNCSVSLVRTLPRRCQVSESTDIMLDILRSWICPATLSTNDLLCQECFNILQRESINYTGSPVERSFGHQEVCFVCGISILRGRTHKVPLDCPERDIFMAIIPTQQVHRLEKVCMSCWVSANRSVKRVRRNAQHDQNRQVETTGADTSPVKTETFTSSSTLAPVQAAQPKIISNIYKRTKSTARYCMFPDCRSKERLLVPSVIKEMLLLEHKLYVPNGTRICRRHLDNGPWDKLVFEYNDFTGYQMDDMMAIMDKATRRQIDFSDIRRMDSHLVHYWLGIDSDKFYKLLSLIPELSEEVPSPSVALSILLVKLRTGDSNSRLSSLFRLSRTSLEKYMAKARNCLENACVQLSTS